MDTDEVLTGRAQKRPQENPIVDALYWHRRKPLSKEEIESFREVHSSLVAPNPRPVVQICDGPHSQSNKSGKGIVIGLEWSF